MIDKCRATLAGKNGEYHFDCPLDKRVLGFAGVTADAFKAEVAKGKGDGELLEWIATRSTARPPIRWVWSWSSRQPIRAVRRRPCLWRLRP